MTLPHFRAHVHSLAILYTMSDRWKLYLVPWLGFVLALGMHLWHLSQPATIVSDETFFVRDGQDYVLAQPYFDPHPPLGKLQLAAVFTFFGYTPFTWRIVNAVEGALLVPVLWWLVWRLSRNRVAANLVVLLSLLDGFLLVESRLGLINVPYILYSFAALAGVLKALESRRPAWWLLSAGTLIGLGVSVKWLAAMIIVPALLLWSWPKLFGQERSFKQSGWIWVISFVTLILLPGVIYQFVFRLHFGWLGVPDTFWQTNIHMLNYHLSVPSHGDPYAQPWWGWLVMWQPFVYWTQSAGSKMSVIWSLPNPWLWWTGVVAFGYSLIHGWTRPPMRLLNVLLLMTWLPFAFIHRVMYSYHAMPFGLLTIMLVAILFGQRWKDHRPQTIAYLAIGIIIFLWFSPLYLNMPLTRQQQRWRQWLPRWHATNAQTTSEVTPRPSQLSE